MIPKHQHKLPHSEDDSLLHKALDRGLDLRMVTGRVDAFTDNHPQLSLAIRLRRHDGLFRLFYRFLDVQPVQVDRARRRVPVVLYVSRRRMR